MIAEEQRLASKQNVMAAMFEQTAQSANFNSRAKKLTNSNQAYRNPPPYAA